jgi:hypothetical protein
MMVGEFTSKIEVLAIKARTAGTSVEQETGTKSILDPLMEVLP